MQTRTFTTRRLMKEMLEAVINNEIEIADSKLNELVKYMKTAVIDNNIAGILLQQHRKYANQTMSQIAAAGGFSEFSKKIESICEEAAIQLAPVKKELNLESKDKNSNNKRKLEEQEQPKLAINKKPKAQAIQKLKAAAGDARSLDELKEKSIAQSVQSLEMSSDVNKLLNEIRKRSTILGNIFSNRYRSQNKNPNKISGMSLIFCLQRALQVMDAIKDGELSTAFRARSVADASIFLKNTAIKKKLDEVILLDKNIHLVDVENSNIKRDETNIPIIYLSEIQNHPAILKQLNAYSLIQPYHGNKDAGLNPKTKSLYIDFKSDEAYRYCDGLFREYKLSGSVFQKATLDSRERSCFLSDTSMSYDDLTEESVSSVLYAVGVVHFLAINVFSVEGLDQVFKRPLPFLTSARYADNTSFFKLVSDGGEEKSISPQQFFDSLAADKAAMKQSTLLDSVKDHVPRDKFEDLPSLERVVLQKEVADEKPVLVLPSNSGPSNNVSVARSPFGTFSTATAKVREEVDPMIQFSDEDEINSMIQNSR